MQSGEREGAGLNLGMGLGTYEARDPHTPSKTVERLAICDECDECVPMVLCGKLQRMCAHIRPAVDMCADEAAGMLARWIPRPGWVLDMLGALSSKHRLCRLADRQPVTRNSTHPATVQSLHL